MNEADITMLNDWYQEHMRGASALDDDQLQLMIRLLDGDVEDTYDILRTCAIDPIGDPRLLPYLEAHLGDHRLRVIGVEPIYYGELRWVAAEAVSAERQKLGINEQVQLIAVVKPVNLGQIARLVEEVGLDKNLKPLEQLEMLIKLGKAPTYKVRGFFHSPRG